MAKLVYKTRGNSTPQGKPRVFFCCHPADFSAFFEEISEEILVRQNCAIWYKEGEDDPADREFLADLSQMQLFVMPVTTRLLTTENPALDVEFSFAMAHHIPVLPLMQESGLEALFNQKCGDLQFLDKHNTDATAISYDEKLEKYLTSVLIGDELAEKIRDAFDAYIFLSYRKKDRQYAQELMRLIHKHDFCRNVAIWYDEFLTPGENFNESIAAALKRCDLVVLAVTPNLVNERNYIMTTEYPLAKKAGKPILPVELVPTSQWKMALKYKGISSCTDARDEERLAAALHKRLNGAVSCGAEDTPTHTFLIGLAYLGGVDVEVDHQRALALLTAAADAGVPPALKKLVNMYRTGEGVERNYRRAIAWQEKLVEHRQYVYTQKADEQSLRQLLEAVCLLGSYCLELRDLEQADRAFRRGLALCKEKENSDSLQQEMLNSYAGLGDVAEMRGDLSAARRYYTHCLRLARKLVKNGEGHAYRHVSLYETQLGQAAMRSGDLDEAITHFTMATEIDESLAEKYGVEKYGSALSISYSNLGNAAVNNGDLAQAQEWYEKALELTQRLAQINPVPQTHRLLALAYDALGDTAKAGGDLAQANQYYQQAKTLFERLAREVGTATARRDLAQVYENLGQIALQCGDMTSARDWYSRSQAVTLALAEECQVIRVRRDVGVSYFNMGNLYEKNRDFAGALEQYEAGIAILEEIAQETDAADMQHNLITAYSSAGQAAEMAENWKKAFHYYMQEKDLASQLADKTQQLEYYRDFAVACFNMGNLYRKLPLPEEAQEEYLIGIAICEELAEKTDTVQAKRDLALGYDRLGLTAQMKKEGDSAIAYFEKSLAIEEKLAAETGTVQERYSAAITKTHLGDAYIACGQYAQAQTIFLSARETLEILAETGAVEIRWALVVVCERLGNVAVKRDDLSEAQMHYSRAVKLQEQIVQEQNTPANQEGLAMSYYWLAEVTETATEQKILYEKAYQLLNDLVQRFPQNGNLAKKRDMVQKKC